MIYRFLVVSKYETLSGGLISILIRNGLHTDEKFPHPNLCHASNFNIDEKEKKTPVFRILKLPFPPPPPLPLTFTTHTTVWLGEHGHNPIYLNQTTE